MMVLKKTWKSQVAKVTSGNMEMNKKALQLKKSWDEVEGLLKSTGKLKKK